MGSNMAEAHPVGFRWPMKAKEKGATLIHVDPRFTPHVGAVRRVRRHPRRQRHRVSRRADQLRPHHERWFKEYVLAYTNAATIIEDGFQDTEDLGGSSAASTDGETGKYDAQEGIGAMKARPASTSEAAGKTSRGGKDGRGVHGHGLMGGATAHSAPRSC